ncbi:DUF3857 domain-containing transglutaminase family protein [Oleiharenicola lentus]|uniref:DUF3857 domain-containing transglutaminase family protein n=1 Tax=Oleiharenicola lentus TaxID=2508720 RepID=UPI003F672B3F
MFLRASVPLFRPALFSLIGSGLLALPALAAKWAPPNPAEVAETKPRLEADAGAEILASETRFDDSAREGASVDYYARIKIFNDQGVARHAKIELPYDDRTGHLSAIEARTIKPDGTIVELSSKEIYDRVVVRSGNQRIRVKSFAPPALEPGAIVEYRYRSFNERNRAFFPFLFQGEFPTRSATVFFRPLGIPVPGLSMRLLFMNSPQQNSQPDKEGFSRFHMENLPSRRFEPFAPPEVHLLASVLIYYTLDGQAKPEAFWGDVSKQLHQRTNDKTKVTKPMIVAAAEIIGGATEPDVKLAKLHDYCRTKILNRDRDGAKLTRDQRRKLPNNDDAADVLKNKSGSSDDINYLFIALAKAAGFDARLASGNNRTDYLYQPTIPVPFAFTKFMAAVKVGDQWSYYDPGATYLPAAMINWRYGETSIAIANDKGALIVPVHGGDSAQSHRRQTADLTLDESGVLEGKITLSYTGQFEFQHKNILDAASKEAAEKYLKEMVDDNLKSVEITEVQIENADHAIEPLRISYHIKVPEFAERTGSRLFVQPSVFRRGAKPLFIEAKRRAGIFFPHRYSEFDAVSITLPEGYAIEEGSAPPDLDLGPGGAYKVKLSWSHNRRLVSYERAYRQDFIGFSASNYERAKQIFEVIQTRDNHMLTFKRVETSTTVPVVKSRE